MLEILLIGAILLYSTVRTNTIIDVVTKCYCTKIVCVFAWFGGRGQGKKQALRWTFFLTLFYRWGVHGPPSPPPTLGDALLIQCIKKLSMDSHRSSSKAPVRVENLSFNVVCKPESDGVGNMVNSKIQLYSSLRSNFVENDSNFQN